MLEDIIRSICLRMFNVNVISFETSLQLDDSGQLESISRRTDKSKSIFLQSFAYKSKRVIGGQFFII